MSNEVEQVSKAFREARIIGEKLMSEGKLTWDSYMVTMLGYEMKLKAMVVSP